MLIPNSNVVEDYRKRVRNFIDVNVDDTVDLFHLAIAMQHEAIKLISECMRDYSDVCNREIHLIEKGDK